MNFQPPSAPITIASGRRTRIVVRKPYAAWKTREGVRQTGRLDAGNLVLANDFGFQSTQNDIGLNFLGGLSLVNGDHEIKWTNLYVRNVTKEATTVPGQPGGLTP